MATYDFEDGLIPSGWITPSGVNAGWSVVASGAYAGTYCLKAGTILDNQSAAIEVTKFCVAGTVSYYRKVSSESNYDFHRFYVDGVEKTDARISGTTSGWTQYTTSVTAGVHTFRWAYTKDSSSSIGSDTTWIDNVVLPELAITATSLTLTPHAPLWLPIFAPAAELALIPQAPLVLPIRIPALPLALTEVAPRLQIKAYCPATAWLLTEAAPGVYTALTLGNRVSLALAAQQPLISYDPPGNQRISYRYRAYLTGEAETPPLSALELSISSFQSTRRNGESTYLAIVVPNPAPYITAINARQNGDLVIYAGFALDEVEMLTELMRVNFESFRYDLGPRSGSGTLTGHKQVTYGNPRARTLTGISYKAVTDGQRRVRCEPDMWLAPGDTAELGDGETFVVGNISYTISPRQATMEVEEVDV